MDIEEIVEELFEAIDAIVQERIKKIKIDKIVLGTIVDNSKAKYGEYNILLDDNISFKAYTDNINYKLNDKVYIRIPDNDYSKQKYIINKFINESSNNIIDSDSNSETDNFNIIKNLQENNEHLLQKIEEQNKTIEINQQYIQNINNILNLIQNILLKDNAEILSKFLHFQKMYLNWQNNIISDNELIQFQKEWQLDLQNYCDKIIDLDREKGE